MIKRLSPVDRTSWSQAQLHFDLFKRLSFCQILIMRQWWQLSLWQILIMFTLQRNPPFWALQRIISDDYWLIMSFKDIHHCELFKGWLLVNNETTLISITIIILKILNNHYLCFKEIHLVAAVGCCKELWAAGTLSFQMDHCLKNIIIITLFLMYTIYIMMIYIYYIS